MLQRLVLLCYFLLGGLLHSEANTPENNIMEEQDKPFFEGDIVLSPVQKAALNIDTSNPNRQQKRAVVSLEGKKWPNGTVPYEFSTLFNDSSINAIRRAMDQIEQVVESSVEFRPRVPSDSDYIHIFPGDGCYSHVGRQGGPQNLSIGTGCEGRGVIMHELIHALGRWHEQSRWDRDNYVTINSKNIRTGFESNFKVLTTEDTSTQGQPYDYDSVMHYDAYAFSSNQLPTIQPNDALIPLSRLGQREKLSRIDERHLTQLYPKSQWSSWGSWGQCSTSCGRGYQRRVRQCLGSRPPCIGTRKEDRSCNLAECPTKSLELLGEWSPWSACSKSCGTGLRVRIRSCVSTPELCEGVPMDEESQQCNTQKCPPEAEWGPWSKWTLCSKSCEGGVRYRSRKCLVESERGGGEGGGDGGVEGGVLADDGSQTSFCAGERIQSMPCFTNVSCGMPCIGSSCGDTPSLDSRERRVYNNTCLAGLVQVGCYQLSPVTITSIDASEGRTILDNITSEAESLKTCGRFATMKGLNFFGLSGSQCYCSSNVTDFIRGGPLEACQRGCTSCVEVYQITEQENFDLTSRAFESCGAGYCEGEEGEELTCSGSTRTLSSLTATVQSVLILLWTTYMMC